MALPKPVGAAAATIGALGGIAVIVTAFNSPNVSQCVTTIFSVFGANGSAIGVAVAGLIATITPIIAWFSHSALPLTPEQATSDAIKRGDGNS